MSKPLAHSSGDPVATRSPGQPDTRRAGEPLDQRLSGTLGLKDVIAQGISVIAPAMSGAFLTYLASTKAGGATPLAYTLGALAMLCVGGVVARFATRMTSAGSLYTYVSRGLGPTMGFLTGWLYAAAFLLLGAAVLGAFGYFMSSFVTQVSASTLIPWYWFSVFGVLICVGLSLFAVSVSTRIQLVFAVASMLVMLGVAIAVIAHGTPEMSVVDPSAPNPGAGDRFDLAAFLPGDAGVGWVGVGFGLSFAMLSFTGADASATLAEETRDPRRAIPRAVIGAIVIAGAFYIVITYATAIGFGVDRAREDWPASVAGLAAVAPNTTMTALVLLAAAVASLLCALGLLLAVSRVLFAMGRERVILPWFGHLHVKHNEPWRTIIFTGVVWVVVVVALIAVTDRSTQEMIAATNDANTSGVFVFSYLATLGTPLVMAVYLLLGVAAVAFGLKHRDTVMAVLGVPAALAGAVALFGGVYYSFVPAAPGAEIPGLIAAIPWVCLIIALIGVGLTLWLRSARRDDWQKLGSVFDET